MKPFTFHDGFLFSAKIAIFDSFLRRKIQLARAQNLLAQVNRPTLKKKAWKLICIFVFAYAKCRFSYDEAHLNFLPLIAVGQRPHKLLVLVNPVSGGKNGKKVYETVAAGVFKEAKIDTEVLGKFHWNRS